MQRGSSLRFLPVMSCRGSITFQPMVAHIAWFGFLANIFVHMPLVSVKLY